MNSGNFLPSLLAGRRNYRILRFLLSAAHALWSSNRESRLAVLFYHRVRLHRDPLFPGEPDRVQFAEVMEVVATCFNCVPLDEALQRLASGRSLPKRAVAITFDDGYADNFTEALPILRAYGLTATFFIASGFLDGGCMWNDEAIESIRGFSGSEIDLRPMGLGVSPCRTIEEQVKTVETVKGFLKYQPSAARREALDVLREITGGARPPRLMLSSDQVREMHSQGMGIGGHTVNHPILACLDDDEAMREISEDRERLAAVVGAAPSLFAYPNGKPGRDYGPHHAAMVRAAGYRAAFTTVWGVSRPGMDMFQLPRFSPWDRQPTRFALRLAHCYTRSSIRLA
jgi:peptidoglycan/xylan/chitin deacetylase (PgdA/CDA1 family)